MSVEINTKETLKNLEKSAYKVSWSKLKAYRNCKGSWFASNFVSFSARTDATESNEKAVPGVIVQKLFEIFFNEKKYTLPDAQLELWLDVNLYWLYHTMKQPLEAQFEQGLDTRSWWKENPEAIKRIQYAISQGADPEVLKKVVPKFFKPENLEGGSEQAFLEMIRGILRKNVELFFKNFPTPSAMISEQFIQSKFMDTILLNGGVDFLYNPAGRPNPYNPSQPKMAKGYKMYDGKFHMSNWVDEDQLHFYANIIAIRDRVMPSGMGFIDWSKAEVIEVEPSEAKFNEFKSSFFAISNVVKKVKGSLSNTIFPTIPIQEVEGITFKPSDKNCSFCPIKAKCDARQQHIAEGGRLKDLGVVVLSDTTVTFN